MSKKRKCIECQNSMKWALPIKVTDENIDYAKHCLKVVKRSFVCGQTMKTKSINNEQYCKHFVEKSFEDTHYKKAIENLERMINEYELQKCVEVGGMNDN